MSTDDLQHLIDQSLNGLATDEQTAALEQILLADEQARDHYINCANLHSSMIRRFAVAEQAHSYLDESPPRRRLAPQVFALAATIVLLIGVAVGIRQLMPSSTQASPLATISQTVGAYRPSDEPFTIGESIDAGLVSIDRGLVQLDFANGASLTLEGPAKLEVKDPYQVILHSGIVTATIPESAIGFTVDTSTARVVDLGTAFGVSVAADGATDVCVFDGEVEVLLSTSEVTASTTTAHLVKEGQSVRATIDSPEIAEVSYNPRPFENAWPLSSGVLQTTGNLRFVSPGPDFHPGNFQDNDNIVVFPERSNFTPDEPILVDLVDPGQYQRTHYKEKRKLAPGLKVTSYLLQLDSYPAGKNPNIQRRVQGQITFARPIVGVITMTRLLQESEDIFGFPDVQYHTAREIEPRPAGDKRPGFDSLVLAADRRTLVVDLMESPLHLDQIRVLVESE